MNAGLCTLWSLAWGNDIASLLISSPNDNERILIAAGGSFPQRLGPFSQTRGGLPVIVWRRLRLSFALLVTAVVASCTRLVVCERRRTWHVSPPGEAFLLREIVRVPERGGSPYPASITLKIGE